jgi:hypothetical protein
MANITPIIAIQDTVQNTAQTTWQDASCETSALADGVEYLVIHCGNMGGDATSAEIEAQLLLGSTQIGYGASEGRGTSNNFDGGQINGYKRVTGNGTDTLKYQFDVITSGDTAYIGAMAIIAIPLTELTENTDFWHSGTNSSSNEVTNASTSGETLRTYSPTLPETGDYLILMSAECTPGSGGTAYGLRASADGTDICQTDTSTYGWREEYETDTDWMNQAWCTMETLSSGSRTFLMRCASYTSATADFRRSNIWTFKKSAFEQIVQNKFSTGISDTSSTYINWSASDQAINPTEQSYIVALGYAVGRTSTYASPVIELYNATDTTSHRTESGEYINDYGTGNDRVGVFLAHCGQYNTGSDTWRFRVRAPSGTVYWGRNLDDNGDIQSNLILWQLTTVEAAAPKQEQLFYGRVM